MSSDPWKHRSKGMLCKTCMWFVVKKMSEERNIGGPEIKGEDLGDTGRCRRRAPTMNGYPVVFETDWCGDHKVDENKI